jgi:putative flippase GtrA
MKFIKFPFLSFVFWGLLNTGLTYLIYRLVLELAPYLIAYTIAYLSGILISYFLNSMLVFKTALHWKKALQYPFVYLLQYLLGSLLISLLIEILGIAPSIAAILNALVLLPISFILSRFILAKKIKEGSES